MVVAEGVNEVCSFLCQNNSEMDFVTHCVLLSPLGKNCNARALLGQCPLREELLLVMVITFPFLVTINDGAKKP